MIHAKRGDPIYHDDKLVARFARDEYMHGQYMRWTWFNPSTAEEMMAGPQYREDGITPVNYGTMSLNYARGDLRVWVAWDLTGDVDNAFTDRRMFLPPEPTDGETKVAVGEAARIVKTALHPGAPREMASFLEHLIAIGDSHANRNHP